MELSSYHTQVVTLSLPNLGSELFSVYPMRVVPNCVSAVEVGSWVRLSQPWKCS